MPGVNCCVPGCYTNSLKHRNLRFYVFPQDTSLRQKWIHNVGRTGDKGTFMPTSTHRVCSRHFCGGRKTSMINTPTIFPLKASASKPPRRILASEPAPSAPSATAPLSSGPASMYDRSSPDWAPTLKLGEILTPTKSQKKLAEVETNQKRFQKAVKRRETMDNYYAARPLLKLQDKDPISLKETLSHESLADTSVDSEPSNGSFLHVTQRQLQMINSVLQGSASRVSRSIHIAPPTTTSKAGNETTRPCYQPKLCHVSCQTDPVQIFPYDAKVAVLDQDCSAKVADLQDIIHDHNYHSSDPSTKFTPTFSQEIKSEPRTFGMEATLEPPTFSPGINADLPTFGLEIKSEPPTFSQNIKSEIPRFGQVIKSEPPTFGLEVTSEPPAFIQEIKSEPPIFDVEVTAEPPRFGQVIKSELPTFGLEFTTEPPTFGLEIKSEPLTHPISSPIPHSVTAEHAHSPPQEIKTEPSSDAAAHTSHNVLLHMNDNNHVVIHVKKNIMRQQLC